MLAKDLTSDGPTRLHGLLRRILAGLRRPHVLFGGGWSLAAIVLIWAGVLLQLHEQRVRSLDAARAKAASLAGAYEDGLAHELREIEQTLLYVRALHARDGAAIDLTPWVNSAELASRAVLRISLTDRAGLVTLIDLHRPAAPIDLSDQPFFRGFADAAASPVDDHLFIGTPMPVGAPGSGRIPVRWSIAFARALMTPQGAFDGVVAVAVDPDSLLRSAQATEVGRRGVVTLTGFDGIVRARAGDTAATGPPIGRQSASPAVARAAAETEGGFDWRDPDDGTRRIDGFRRVAGYKLVVEVALATDTVLLGARDDFVAALLAGLVLSVAVAAAGSFAGRRASGRAVTQRMLGAALQHVDQGLILLDPHGRIAMMNRRAIAMLEIPERFVAGAHFGALLEWQRRQGEFRLGEPAILSPEFMASRPELAVPQGYTRTRPNGTVLEVHTHPLPDGWMIRTYADVTASVRVEAALAATRDAVAALALPGAPIAAEPAPLPANGLVPAAHLAIEHLTETLGGDAVVGIVASFFDGLPRQLARMADLAGDTDPLLREAHALAVSAATIGLDELGAAASELEEDLKWRRLGAIPARLDRIDRLARTGLERLSAYLDTRAA